jgi:hypothetical protein
MNTTDGNDPQGGQSEQPEPDHLDHVSELAADATETPAASDLAGVPLFNSVDAFEKYCKAYLTEQHAREGIHLIACMLISSDPLPEPSDIGDRLRSAKQEVDSLTFMQRVLRDMQKLFYAWDNVPIDE